MGIRVCMCVRARVCMCVHARVYVVALPRSSETRRAVSSSQTPGWKAPGVNSLGTVEVPAGVSIWMEEVKPKQGPREGPGIAPQEFLLL